jgi:lipoyl(octanoyl) transferase
VSDILIRDLGVQPFTEVWDEMRRFTSERDAGTQDQIWFVEHSPVFTLGLNADPIHLLRPGDIPVVKTDRGGQVTYHGPGQLVAYVLVELHRRGLHVRSLVQALELAVVDAVAPYGIAAVPRRDAPGVYVGGRKLAAVGLRVRRGCSYHGIAINVAMDLEPFTRINPCGFADLEVTQLADLCSIADAAEFRAALAPRLAARLGQCRSEDSDR